MFLNYFSFFPLLNDLWFSENHGSKGFSVQFQINLKFLGFLLFLLSFLHILLQYQILHDWFALPCLNHVFSSSLHQFRCWFFFVWKIMFSINFVEKWLLFYSGCFHQLSWKSGAYVCFIRWRPQLIKCRSSKWRSMICHLRFFAECSMLSWRWHFGLFLFCSTEVFKIDLLDDCWHFVFLISTGRAGHRWGLCSGDVGSRIKGLAFLRIQHFL